MATTLLEIKASRIPQALKLCANDPRLLQYVNEACNSLLVRRESRGTTQRLAICVADGNITWPRFVASVESLAVNNSPIRLRNEWFEFLPAGPGIQSPDSLTPATTDNQSGGFQGFDRDPAPIFADISGSNKVLKIYCDNAADAGKRILFKALDANGNKYYDAAGLYEGFYITLAFPFVLDNRPVTEIYGVVKDQTLGVTRGYQYDTVALTQSAIFAYEPTEANPMYRRTLVNGLAVEPACPDCSLDASNKKTVIAGVKIEFIPVARDTDFLVIGNIRSIKLACQAILKEEANSFAEAAQYWAAAEIELDKEYTHYSSAGDVVTLRVESPGSFGCGVENLI